MPTPPDQITLDTFQPLVGSTFRVRDTTVELRLERATAANKGETPEPEPQPFSLFFRGPGDSRLQQSIYSLAHRNFRDGLSLFLVPVGRSADGFEYRAVVR